MTYFAGLDPEGYRPAPAQVQRILTPALFVQLDLVRANVRRVITHLHGRVERWRPHVKTTKLPSVWRILAEEGIRHFKCATTRELDVLLATLHGAGVPDSDVLVAYPHRPPALERLASIATAHPRARVSVLIEDPGLLAAVPAPLDLFVDLNPGMQRTGLPVEDTTTLLRLVSGAGARYRGLHWYDGHIHDENAAHRRARVQAGLARATALVELIRTATGIATGELISSGTPAFLASLDSDATAAWPHLCHRLSPGTVVFHDLASEIATPDLALRPAAVLLTRVISHPAPGLVTTDAGSKSIAVDGQPLCEVLGHPELTPQTPSEEHLPFAVQGNRRPERGDLLALVPGHICPTVNLATEALMLDESGELRAEPVAARAHELLA